MSSLTLILHHGWHPALCATEAGPVQVINDEKESVSDSKLQQSLIKIA
jgi:hypothetical protein